MLSNKNRIFIPNIIDTSRVNEVLSQFPSNPSLDITMIKLMATGAALNDQFYSNPRLAPIGLETTKFIDFVNLIRSLRCGSAHYCIYFTVLFVQCIAVHFNQSAKSAPTFV